MGKVSTLPLLTSIAFCLLFSVSLAPMILEVESRTTENNLSKGQEVHKSIEESRNQILQQSTKYLSFDDGKTGLLQEPLGGWMSRVPMPTKRAGLAIGVVNNKIYAIGGEDPFGDLSTNEEYDPTTNIWKSNASMPTARRYAAIGVVNNRIYVIGGANQGNILSTNEEYDPNTDTWTTKAPMPNARYLLAIGVVNNKIYAIGGMSSSGFLNVNEGYDPATDTWTTNAPMPTSRTSFTIGVGNNKIYAIGGNSAIGTGSINEEYDPVTDTWTTKAPMPTPRQMLSSGVVNDKIYVIGGEWFGDTNVNEEYDPTADVWEIKTPMPLARRLLSTGVVNDRIYAIGGYSQINGQLLTVEEYNPCPPDLTISDVAPTVVYVNTTMQFDIVIQNVGFGNASAKYLNASFSMDSIPIGGSANQNLNVLVGDSLTASANWLSPKTIGFHVLSVSFYTDIGGGTPVDLR